MSKDPLFLIASLACLAVLVVLMIGIGGFAKGGEFNRKHANRISATANAWAMIR